MKFNYNKLKVGVSLGAGSNYCEKTKVRIAFMIQNLTLIDDYASTGTYWDTRIVSYLSVDYILFKPELIKKDKDRILLNYEYEC
jgi:hypothetical protein